MSEEKFKYVRVQDLFRNATPTTIAEDVRKQIQEENDRPITTSEAYRAAGLIYVELGRHSAEIVFN